MQREEYLHSITVCENRMQIYAAVVIKKNTITEILNIYQDVNKCLYVYASKVNI